MDKQENFNFEIISILFSGLMLIGNDFCLLGCPEHQVLWKLLRNYIDFQSDSNTTPSDDVNS